MKNIAQYIFLISVLFCFSTTMAQIDSLTFTPIDVVKKAINKNIKELGVGDKVPEYKFLHPLINYKSEKASLSDFNSKLIIVEIWSLGCASCIAGFPKLQALQEEFNDQIQILLINPWGDKEQIVNLLEQREQASGFKLTLPIAFGDLAFYDWFSVNGSVNGVPHFIWIKDSEIVSVTHSLSVNANNILAILSGEKINMPQKMVKIIEHDRKLPLFLSGNAGNGRELMWHSMLSSRIDGLPSLSLVSVDSTDNKSKILVQNSTIQSLLSLAYGTPRHPLYDNYLSKVPFGRIKLEVPDSSKYLLRVKGEYKWENLYTYEMQPPHWKAEEELLRMMQEDLNRYFSIKVTWEKQKVRCLVLKMTDSTLLDKLSIKKEFPLVWSSANNMTVNIENCSADQLVFWMEKSSALAGINTPIINETGYRKNLIGIHMKGINVGDWSHWSKGLEKFGLTLEMAYREIDVLVVREI